MNALEKIGEAMAFLRQTGHDIGLPVVDTACEAGWHIQIDGKLCYNDILRLFDQEKAKAICGTSGRAHSTHG
jgi:hypothetical protein